MSHEFEIIDHYFKQLDQGLNAGDIGIGDDGAVISIPKYKGLEQQMVVVTDTLVQGIHFPENTCAYDIAWKALAVNLSDLASMGARPWCYSLALSVPKSLASEEWFRDFSQGLKDLCSHLSIELPLIGGDTTSAKEGALSVTVCAKGLVVQGKAVKRSGAMLGDLIVVTENIGEGALGLEVALQNAEVCRFLSEAQKEWALKALNRPIPQTQFGKNSHSLINSAIDISDGLLQDLQHILHQSASEQTQGGIYSLGAEIQLESIPVSDSMKAYIEQTQDWQKVLSGGDDYQLCMTLDEEKLSSLQVLAQELGVKISVIGKVIENPQLELTFQGQCYGEPIPLNASQNSLGFQHF